MHGDAAKPIWDAQQALQRIKRFVANKDFAVTKAMSYCDLPLSDSSKSWERP